MGFLFRREREFNGCLVALALVGCGGDSSANSNAALGTGCAVGEFILQGTLGGEGVSHRGTVASAAWIQAGSPSKLDASFEPKSSLHAEWQNLVTDGQTTVITGSVTLPAGIPHGGETLNSTAGNLTKLDDEVRFEYSELSVSVACIQAPCAGDPVEGSLHGCLHWKPIGP